jgi:acetyl esterase/lipase
VELSKIGLVRDVAIGRAAEGDLVADIYAPHGGVSRRTAIISLHGGGFLQGSKASARMAGPLVSLGYTLISSEYRLGYENQWPAPIEDAKAAIRWTRANSDRLRVDPNHIVVLGHSSGGRLALIAAGSANLPDLEGSGGNDGVSSDVAACVAFYAAAGDATRAQIHLHPSLSAASTNEEFRSFNPITHLRRPGFPPTILFHGTGDRVVPAETSQLVYQALVENGAQAELHLIDGVDHGFDRDPELADACARWIDLFLQRHTLR